MKSYHEMLQYSSFEDRVKYLRCYKDIGIQTFGEARWLNQEFYSSPEWKNIRNYIIVRDKSCDLAMPGYDIRYHPVIHHINPLTVEDFESDDDTLHNKLFDPDNLVCISFKTHNYIHGGKHQSDIVPVERTANDTKLW